MIPKIIHYCWFGDKEPGELEQKCINSWKKILPEYKIKRWGNECIKMFDNKYFNQAIAAKKWAFASDYVRLYALLNEGGIYFDTDTEALKPLDDFLDHDFVIGSQKCGSAKGISTAFFACKPQNIVLSKIFEIYDNIEFNNLDGSYNQTPNNILFEQVLEKNFNVKDCYIKNGRAKITSNSYIYPLDYFSKPSKNAYAVHHYSGSWRPAWRVREKFSFNFLGNSFSFRKYKHKTKHGADEKMPIAENEKFIFTIKVKKHTRFILVKTS